METLERFKVSEVFLKNLIRRYSIKNSIVARFINKSKTYQNIILYSNCF